MNVYRLAYAVPHEDDDLVACMVNWWIKYPPLARACASCVTANAS